MSSTEPRLAAAAPALPILPAVPLLPALPIGPATAGDVGAAPLAVPPAPAGAAGRDAAAPLFDLNVAPCSRSPSTSVVASRATEGRSGRPLFE